MGKRIGHNTDRNFLIVKRFSDKYNFVGDSGTGITFRWGRNLNEDPVLAPWPELADISISNHCTKGCNFCYRNSKPDNSFISLNDYEYILKSLKHSRWGNVFQVALGGGEPLEHPDFIKLIDKTLEYGIVPNFTTNGLHLNDDIAKKISGKIGALAVSSCDIKELANVNTECLIQNKIKTNIHFLLNRSTLDQAIEILNGVYNEDLKNFNSVIFLTYKPVGRADTLNNLILDEKLKKFVDLIDINRCNIGIGFDACFVPMLLCFTKTDKNLIESCECAFFSVYIDERLNVKPCSFAPVSSEYSFNLKEFTFEDIWMNKFSNYREKAKNNCKRKCANRIFCRGGCPYYKDINFCYSDKIIE